MAGGRGGPASGGLAVLARGGRRVARVPVEGKFGPRWLHAVVEADQGKPLHVVSVYGFDSGQPEAAGRNAALFQEIFEAMAGLGATQWVVGGDWNEESSAIWTLVAAEGRGLLLPRAPEGDGPVERGTCEPGGRRIDFFVASPALAGRVGVETVLREAPLQPHKPVRLDVTVGGAAALVPMLDTPKPFLVPDDPPPGGAEALWGECLG